MNKIKYLKKMAAMARAATVEALVCAGCGHPGGAFSSLDLLVALYFSILRIKPGFADWNERDRFILSKGHSSIGLYSVLHLRKFINRRTFLSFRKNGSVLGGHPDMRKIPGVEMSTGSLGHGLAVGVGMAICARFDRLKHRVFVLLGDGETQEGSVWESAMSASQYKLDNLVAIVDRNMLQIDGSTEDVMALEPFKKKWVSFGWGVREIDGHDFKEIISAFEQIPFVKGKPSVIIAKTIKGKGISFMENNLEWHGKALKGDYALKAKSEVCKF